MKSNGFERRKSIEPSDLESLDSALHELGMLSAVTDARRGFLAEAGGDVCMMRLNTQYVSNVTVGYCMRRTTIKSRLCPYVLPVRHRTKSENSETLASDVSDNGFSVKNMWRAEPEPSTSGLRDGGDPAAPAKRCLSLENLNLSLDSPPIETSQEMDSVSNQIEKLQVDE